LELSEDSKKVKRKFPVPQNVIDELNSRTVYIKGFPQDDKVVTRQSVTKLFSKYGKVLSVRHRRQQDKHFKGSLYVEFEKEDIAKKCIVEGKELKWDDTHPLEMMTKKEHSEEKKKEIETAKEERTQKKEKQKLIIKQTETILL